MSDRPYLSIGEVLGLLLEEFPDITISKIRFLESQGLIDPERTPSGYRKFYDDDVERLRFILREQKERYLPLKVIRDRLEQTEGEPSEVLVASGGAEVSDGPELPPAATRTHPSARAGKPAPVRLPPPPPEPVVEDPVPDPVVENPRERGELTREELVAAAGVDLDIIADLESFGLISGQRLGDTFVYDATACEVAEVAARFVRLGVEVRHLRAWRTSAERETSLFEQRVMPLLRQRNPRARDESIALLHELTGLGGRLHEALVRQALKPYLDPH